MGRPAATGLFLYAKQPQRLAAFYEAVAGLRRCHEDGDFLVLDVEGGIQLLVHAIPEPIARHIVIDTPPKRREDTALKFFFSVPSLSAARARAQALGGEVFTENWRGPGFRVCNAMDPEGNVFQLREPA